MWALGFGISGFGSAWRGLHWVAVQKLKLRNHNLPSKFAFNETLLLGKDP